MAKRQTSSQREKDYAFRRVIYDALVAVKSMIEFPSVHRDFSKKESLKTAALIMGRNLNAFLYHTDYGHCDDIHVGDFGLSSWKPAVSAAMGKVPKKRINKLVGHVVTSHPDPFKDDQEVLDLLLPLIREACEFIRQCRQEDVASYRGAAKSYVPHLNSLLVSLGLAGVPER